MIFSILICLLLALSISGFHWSGNVLYDLEFQDQNFFDETGPWECNTTLVIPGAKSTYCGPDTILGGYNIMGPAGAIPTGAYWYRTYDNLPSHNSVKLQIKVYPLDTWDGDQYGKNDYFEINIDGTNFKLWSLKTYGPSYVPVSYAPTDLCGNPNYNDLPYLTAYITLAHSANMLDLQLVNELDEPSDWESIGFREIVLTFSTESPAVSKTFCGITSSGYPLPNNACSCGSGTSMTKPSSGLCGPCHSSCATCNGASSSSCLSCPAGYYLSSGSCLKCNSPCATCSGGADFCISCETGYGFIGGSVCYQCQAPLIVTSNKGVNYCQTPCTGKFAYWDGSCSSLCPSPYVQKTIATYLLCTFPCADQTMHYYLWNSSCISGCPSPLTQSSYLGRNFCNYGCTASQYLYWNGSCLSGCESPLISETQGTTNQRKFCWYPCQPSEYLYWNGSCMSTCSSLFIPETQGTATTRKFCWYPCQPNEYLYWNGSCASNCLSPLTSESQGTRNFCWYPCQSNEYLYWNGSCMSTCPSPLSAEVQGTTVTRNFCWYACQPDQYLYSNMSCLNTCPSPLSTEVQGTVEQRNFCWFPCQPGEYLYWNESCFSTCPLPLMIVNNSEISYCFLPCASPTIYWYKNSSCLPACDYPYNIIPYSEVSQCLSPCKDSEYFYDQESKCYPSCNYPYEKRMIDIVKICHLSVTVTLEETENILSKAETMKAQGEYTSGAMKGASAISSSSPASALLAGLSSMLMYIRYMKINYPPKVKLLFMVSAGNPISLGFDFGIPAGIQEKLVDYPLPDVFEKYDINSNFVNNMWDFMMSLVTNLVVIGMLTLLDVVSRKYERINKIISKILQVMKWNTPLAMVCSSCGDIFFYASLQLQSSPLDSMASVLCFIVCIVMMVLVGVLFTITVKIMQSYHRQKKNREKETQEDWKDKWSSCAILFIQYEETALLSVGYMALFILRGVIFNLTIANLYNFPLTQCLIINLANVLMFGYLLYWRPLKDLLAIIQLFVTEGIVNTVGICVLILAIMDKANLNGDRQASRIAIGNIMSFLIQAFNTSALVFMGIGMLLFLISAYRIWKLMRRKGIKSASKLFQMIASGEIEAETAKTADLTSLPKRPKILKPPRREKPVDESTMSVIHLDSTDNSMVTFPAERSGNILEKSFQRRRRLDPLKLHHHRQSTGELEITEFDSTQTVFEHESPERPFRGLDETFLDEVKDVDKSVLEKDILTPEKPDMSESLKKLKERVNNLGDREVEVEERQRHGKIRKLESRLKNRPNPEGGINLENSGNS